MLFWCSQVRHYTKDIIIIYFINMNSCVGGLDNNIIDD